jgi:hypothetical protein
MREVPGTASALLRAVRDLHGEERARSAGKPAIRRFALCRLRLNAACHQRHCGLPNRVVPNEESADERGNEWAQTLIASTKT